MTKVVVSGAMANKHLNGGESWVRLNWALGFLKLGFKVFFVEQIDANSCVDWRGEKAAFEESVNLAYFKKVIGQFGLSELSALVYEDGLKCFGLSFSELLDVASEADLLINISGHLRLESLMNRFRRKVYVDIDPGFTQFWHADENIDFCVGGHNFYYTIGENIGQEDCLIPTGGIDWKRIRPPVVLDQWKPVSGTEDSRFTTIANWRGPFGSLQYNGKTFGLKVHEFRKVIELPQLSAQQFEIALNIHPAESEDLNRLLKNGWHITAPQEVASDPVSFRNYVQKSKAEFSVAQGVYVDTNSGWFSDRTVDYLASGKPALVQDTGFSRNYPVGEGLMPFRNLKEAVNGAEQIAGDYEKHCRAARQLAEEYFDSDKVLTRLINEVGI
jgi:hypothetical protein